jgi:hypothetical protein
MRDGRKQNYAHGVKYPDPVRQKFVTIRRACGKSFTDWRSDEWKARKPKLEDRMKTEIRSQKRKSKGIRNRGRIRNVRQL